MEDAIFCTCIHECGHAAAALLLGVEGIGAVVFDAGGGLATPTPETDAPPVASDYTAEKLDDSYRFKDWPRLWRDAVFTAAGMAAVDMLLRPDTLESVPTGCDAEMLNAAARSACPGADVVVQMNFAAMAAARARALLKPVLWRVRLVAKALYRRPGPIRRMMADDIALAMFPEITARRLAVNVDETKGNQHGKDDSETVLP